MSTSFYRGKLVTSKELKGPFTEAFDEMKGRPFDILRQVAMENKAAELHVHDRSTSDRPASVFICFGGVTIEITEDGGFEFLEGAA